MFLRGVICLSLLLLLVPAVGGFTIDYSDGIPDGYTWSGEDEEINITIGFPGFDPLTFPTGDTLILQTELKSPIWDIDIVRNGIVSDLRGSFRNRETITGWEISFPSTEEIGLIIRVRGCVPDLPEAQAVSFISVRQLDSSNELRSGNVFSISQIAYPAGSVPSGNPPDPVIVSPPPPDYKAFTVSSGSTSPTGSLLPGESTTLKTYLCFDRLSSTTFPDTDTLRLRTALLDAKWAVSIFMNGGENVRSSGRGYYYSIPGFELAYPARNSLGLSVSVTGTVPAASSAPLLEISQCGSDGYAREGATFVHPAGIALIEETPAQTPVETPVSTPVVTVTNTPAPTATVTPLPTPSKGEVFPDGITIEALLDLSNELIGHGTLFLKRILSVFGM